MRAGFEVIVIGGGHAGAEAAWAAANLLPGCGTVAMVTLDPSKIGVMSCNPAIGGLAKGQLVREIDAMGGLMGLAADASGIMFKVLNTSKGAAVHGPRAQCDKHAYAEHVQRLIAARQEITVIAGAVDDLIVENGRLTGVVVAPPPPICGGGVRSRESLSYRSSEGGREPLLFERPTRLLCRAAVLTTGTFMRALMHCGEQKTEGGRYGEAPAVGISASLSRLGFELGRLKTGTPPRLRRESIDWGGLPPQKGDLPPVPFSDLSEPLDARAAAGRAEGEGVPFPVLRQTECRLTETNDSAHRLIRANLHRAPMYSGQIESVGPRYCPSIEDKVVRFAERTEHHVFLEPESLRDSWIYCNGISTSLPPDVQDQLVRSMRGCENAEILRYGYAVEYDMVRPHQLLVTGMTKNVRGLFLAGQINGTSGYEEAAAQGLIAGINAANMAMDRPEFWFTRDMAYIGVLMDDLVTKTPVEPYRMFTSRAEHRLLLRADNSADRLTGVAIHLGLLGGSAEGRLRVRRFEKRRESMAGADALIDKVRMVDGRVLAPGASAGGVEPDRLADVVRRPEFSEADLRRVLNEAAPLHAEPGPIEIDDAALRTVYTDRRYAAYIVRAKAEIRRHSELETRRIPPTIDYQILPSLRTEAKQALSHFRPATLGQAARLEGITPADMTLLAVLVQRHRARAC